MSLLDSIVDPSLLKHLSLNELKDLSEEIRARIIAVTSQNGGHIGPNLGVVELTIGLHRVFDFKKDHIVYDVSHQGYVHKLLTGRNKEDFSNLRKTGGVSGFLSRDESPYDHFGAGHAGTALSAALGMATARDLRGSDEHVIAFIGDATMTCGISMEALNNVAHATKRLIVILNDNEWSIAKNVGAIAKYLNELITNPTYNKINRDIEQFLARIPGGSSLRNWGSKAKKETKDFFVPSSLFEKYGLRYLGPIDGHNLEEVEKYLNFCKDFDRPIVLHVNTKKGQGYDVAIKNPEKFHGTGAFCIETGESIKKSPPPPPAYQDVFGEAMVRFAKNDPKVVGITAAMPSGTGLNKLAKEVPTQFFDVGIAEEHAVLFAAGLATEGFKPVVAIYSTFLQRAFDPIIHDVCLQNLPVLFCMDRAGLSPNDGPTHHGLFDIAYLRCVPNALIMAPKDEDELVDMMNTGLRHGGPAFIRYPRGSGLGVPVKPNAEALPIGKAEVLVPGDTLYLWALGTMVEEAVFLAEALKEELGVNACVVNLRFVKPLDKKLLISQAKEAKLIITLEDGVLAGGVGSAILEVLNEEEVKTPVKRIGWGDEFVGHGTSVNDLRSQYGLDRKSMLHSIVKAYEAAREEVVL